MSAGVQRSVFFLGLPDLNKLCCVTLTLQEDEEELRSRQIRTCRELVLLYADILASPALDSFAEITAVMAIPFFQKGIVQLFGQRRGLQLSSPQCVFPGVLQCCLSYSLISRLAPSWNKAGLYLISGRDFLRERGRLSAVGMELSTSQGQLCISVEANTIRLPPTTLEDFGLPPLVLNRFCCDPDAVLDPSSIGGAVWCHVLPSMKKGQIISISRRLPPDGPFRTYRDLQNHWNYLYGYRLPDLAEEEVVYCSVYFRLVGDRLFTYPLSCVRLQPVQRCPRVDLQGALGSFLSDVRDRLQSVCGFPARLTGKPRYGAVTASAAATLQVLSSEQVTLTTSSSTRLVLTQLPPPPPPRPVRPPFASQPLVRAPLSQQDGDQGLLGNGCGFRSSLTHSQGRGGAEYWPSASSSLVTLSDSSGYQSAPSLSSSLPLLHPASSLTSSSSSSLPLFQPASSLTSSSSSSSLPLLHPASSLTSSFSSSLPLLQPASSLTSSSSSSSLPLLQPASSLTSSFSSSLPLLHPASSLTSSSSSSLPLFQPASSLTSSSSSLPLLQPASSLTSSSSSSSLPLLQPASSLTSSSFSSSLPLLQPASSLTTSSSSSSLPLLHPASSLTSPSTSSVLPPLPSPSHAPVAAASKLVPIFKNKRPSHRVTVAQLQLQKEQQSREGEATGRVTLPAFRRKAPPTASSSSSDSSLSAVSLPFPPRFNRRSRPPEPNIKHIHSLSPASGSRPGFTPAPKLEIKFKSRTYPKTILKKSAEGKTAAPPLTSSEISSSSRSKGGVMFQTKPKKSRSAVQDVDVEKMARSNQLSRLNSATLLAWLRGRGALVSAKHRKEDLILKVMGCLAEA